MNNIIIHGRLTKDPELGEYTTSKGEKGKSCKFTVAVNRRFGEEADFFNCIIWGSRAEVINKFFKKGSEIVLSGEMQCNPYEKDGVKKYPWSLVVGQFDFCGSKKGEDRPVDNEVPEGFEAIQDEDIPF